MTRTGQAAIDAANSHVGTDWPGGAGYCLAFTRWCFDVPSRYASAIDAWNAAKLRHPGDRNPPPAVPVFFQSASVYDHVCIRVEGTAIVSTWNAEVRKYPDLASVERAFGPYLGWTEDLNGVTVYTPDQGDDWLSYLSYDEQRRVLAWADQGPISLGQVRSVADATKANTDRLPTIQGTTDQTLAQANNNHNGILHLIDLVEGLTAPTGRALAYVALVVIVAAIMGVLVALYLAHNVSDGALAAGSVLLGGLIGYVGGSDRAVKASHHD